MRKLFVFLGVVLMTIGSAVRAQEADSTVLQQKSSWGDAETMELTDYIPDIYLDTRVGYDNFFYDGTGRFGATGLFLDLNGRISPRLSYSFNHIIAGPYFPEEPQGFDATQWLNFTYETGDFAFTLGKLSSVIGNFEYDADLLDAYFDMNSMFYNMIDCYQWGLQADWYPADNHSILFQFTNSPLASDASQFAYNLAWRAELDCYEPYWSANLWQFDTGRFVKSLNLGNRFHFGGFSIDLEYMTRAASMKRIFADDFNIIAAPSYKFGEWCRIFGKFGWEHTAEDLPYELAYAEYAGGDYLYYGAGVEVFPFKEMRNIRLHAFWTSNNFGDSLMNIGLRWKLDVTSGLKRILGANTN